MAISSNATLYIPFLLSRKSRPLRSTSDRVTSLSFAASSANTTSNSVDADDRRLTVNGNAAEGTQTQQPPAASLWRRIQGTDDWKDLLEPLSPILREEIVRYGELVLACYKVFDFDPTSDRYLDCKYGEAAMFHDVGMVDSGYKVTKYIYACPGIEIPLKTAARGSRWIGYVAVSSDEAVSRFGRRDILVAFRGTMTSDEWIANLMISLEPARLDPHNPRPDVKVQSGLLGLYTSDDSASRFGSGSCREQLLSEVTRILGEHKGQEEVSITVAGHSMGSSLALLLGYDLAELGLNRDGSGREIPVTVYSFGGPRVGNVGFKERCEALGVKALRVVNMHDAVTKMPGFLLNDNFRVLAGRFEVPWSSSCYAHVGIELTVDFSKGMGPVAAHDLDAYIGLLKCDDDSTDTLAAIKNNIKESGNLLRSKLTRFLEDARQWRDAVARNVHLEQIGAIIKTCLIGPREEKI